MFDTPHVKNYRAEAFDFEACPVCKPTVLQALVIPSTPLRRASPEFRLVKRRWDNFRKWASSSGIQSSWRNQNAVVILGMARHSVTPGPTLRAFLDDPPPAGRIPGVHVSYSAPGNSSPLLWGRRTMPHTLGLVTSRGRADQPYSPLSTQVFTGPRRLQR